MQKKKIVAGITAIVVLALLFAGVGYAFSGTARTYNQGDEQTLAYMSVTPSSFDPIFDNETGGTIFDTYVYDASGTKTAYAFKNASAPVEVPEDATYTAIELGTVNLTVLNNTGAALSALNIAINATGNVGSPDFVYIFKLQIGAGTPALYAFKGANAYTFTNFTASIADGSNAVIAVTVYIGYVANVYVPSTYIGPAADNEGGYLATSVWDDGMQYYTKEGNVYTAASPTKEQVEEGGYYYKAYNSTLPYILPTEDPRDLLSTSFGIVVTDATPAP